MSGNQTKKKNNKPSGLLSQLLIFGGVIIIIAVLVIYKSQPVKEVPSATENYNAEELLDQYLQEGRPIFIFFHSNNCQSCIDMMNIVDQIYPAYADAVELVDVNVYDPSNQALLQRAQIHTIPTQYFVDVTGEAKFAIGVMDPAELGNQLKILAEGVQ